MTRQYMDFAPVKKKTAGRAMSSQRRVVVAPERVVAPGPVTKMPSSNAAPRSRIGVRPMGGRRVVSDMTIPSGNNKVKPVARSTNVSNVRPASNAGSVSRPRANANVRYATSSPKANTNVRYVAPSSKELSKNGMPRKRSTVKLGEIEDLNPKFVVADVPKRPLNDGTNTKPEAKKDDASVAKSKRIGGRLRSKRATKLSAKQEKTESKVQKSAEKNETYNVPKSPFINQDKVVKRPLSGKTYQPQNVPAIQPEGKKTNGKPVTIIAKPKKDSRVGMVVTIILTIILGAVAGTVAFLLLPK